MMNDKNEDNESTEHVADSFAHQLVRCACVAGLHCEAGGTDEFEGHAFTAGPEPANPERERCGLDLITSTLMRGHG